MQISVQSNGGNGNYVMDHIHPFLNRSFSSYSHDRYFRGIDGFAVLVRVAGEFGDFGGGEGPERLRKPGRDTWLIVDLVIPTSAWIGKRHCEFVAYFADQLSKCFELMVARARQRGWLADEDALRRDFSTVIASLRETDPGPWPWGSEPAYDI